jgi:Pyruvate/2-oxoacid:ferredoxin oxidoreductase gamma subunit
MNNKKKLLICSNITLNPIDSIINEKNKFTQDTENRKEAVKRLREAEKIRDEEKDRKLARMLENEKKNAALERLVNIVAAGTTANRGDVPEQNGRLDKIEADVKNVNAKIDAVAQTVSDGFAAMLARLPPPTTH